MSATTTKALHVDTGPAATLALTDRPLYRPIGGGRFEPANAAAIEEIRRWNDYADVWNARTASKGLQL